MHVWDYSARNWPLAYWSLTLCFYMHSCLWIISLSELSRRHKRGAPILSRYFSPFSPSKKWRDKILRSNQCSPVCQLYKQGRFFSASCMLVVAKFSHRNMQPAYWVSSRMANWIYLFLTACLYHLIVWVISHRRWEESLFLHEQICPSPKQICECEKIAKQPTLYHLQIERMHTRVILHIVSTHDVSLYRSDYR